MPLPEGTCVNNRCQGEAIGISFSKCLMLSCPPVKLTSSKVWVFRGLWQRFRNSVQFWQGNKNGSVPYILGLASRLHDLLHNLLKHLTQKAYRQKCRQASQHFQCKEAKIVLSGC
eukprot:1148163-Pelagomonas_calceolata.AAC.1